MKDEEPDGSPGTSRGKPRSVLIVDDDERLCKALGRNFAAAEWEVQWAINSAAALAAAQSCSPNLIIVDVLLGEENGLDLVARLRAEHPDARIVVVSGGGTVDVIVEAMHLGATSYVPKPADVIPILEAVGRADRILKLRPQLEGDQSLDGAARRHIERILATCDGNKTKAAQTLGIDRGSLLRKLRKLKSIS